MLLGNIGAVASRDRLPADPAAPRAPSRDQRGGTFERQNPAHRAVPRRDHHAKLVSVAR